MAVTIAVLTSQPSLLPCQLDRLAGQVHLHPDAQRISTVGVGSVSDDTLLLRRYASAEAPASLGDAAFGDPATALVFRAEYLRPSASA
jgi:hypothetical protein